MSYWVAEKSYNKVTTGKWHGNEPRPKGAPKPKPKPTLVKSRVRPRHRAAGLEAAALCWPGAQVALNARGFVAQINDAIRGTSFVDDEDDPFEGLSPEEIEARLCTRCVAATAATHCVGAQALVAKEAPSGDPFEGMTPEEINDYLQREKAERQAHLDAEAAEAAEAARTT